MEHVIETREWMDRLIQLLAGHDVYFVGVHCPLDGLYAERLDGGKSTHRRGRKRFFGGSPVLRRTILAAR